MLRSVVTLILISCTAPLVVVGQRDFDAVEIETVTIRDGLYMLVGAGGNIGLSVGSDGTFLVDDQYAPLTEKIQAAVKALTDDPVQFLVNTHWHGDHTGGNENFGQAGSIIVAHANVRRRLSVDQFMNDELRSAAAPSIALPKITFSDEVDFYWNDDDIHIFHVEHAHTDGDAIIHFRSANVFHMGDVFFNDRYPYIDLDSGGHVDGIIAAADRVSGLANSETRIIPGHGPVASVSELRAYRDMLTDVRDRIQTMLNDGKSEDEIVTSQPTSSHDAKWKTSEEWAGRFVRSVVRSLNE